MAREGRQSTGRGNGSHVTPVENRMRSRGWIDTIMIPLQQFESLWDAMYRMHTSMNRKATHS